jgi:PAS domain S-box-containing protein/putative nucleotidyltransferase with HDIG domain
LAHAVFAAVSDAVLICDLGTLNILEANPAATEMYGYSHEELRAMCVLDLGADPARLREHLQEVVRSAKTLREIGTHCRKDGRPLAVDVSGTAFAWREQQLVIIVARDYSERDRAEQALRDSESKFRGLIEQSIDGVYIMQNDRFAYVNPRFAEILGTQVDQVVGQSVLESIAPEDRDRVAESIRQRVSGEVTSLRHSFSMCRTDGQLVAVEAHGSVGTYRGAPAIIGLLQDVTERRVAEDAIRRYVQQVERTLMGTVEAISAIAELRDSYTASHGRRVGQLAEALALAMGMSPYAAKGMRVMGLLHDIGKTATPAEILVRPGRLSDPEMALVRQHSQQGYEILKGVDFPWPVAQAILQHHERLDGSGYPNGLVGDQIILEARILAVADVVEAMASHRPYRPALGIDRALAEIEGKRDQLYDRTVADACLCLFRQKGYALD